MPRKILLLDNVSPRCAEVFEKRGFQADQPPKMELDELKKVIGDYTGVVVRSATTVDADLLQHAKHLEVIGRAGYVVDTIDIDVTWARYVMVMSLPGGDPNYSA